RLAGQEARSHPPAPLRRPPAELPARRPLDPSRSPAEAAAGHLEVDAAVPLEQGEDLRHLAAQAGLGKVVRKLLIASKGLVHLPLVEELRVEEVEPVDALQPQAGPAHPGTLLSPAGRHPV